MLHEKREHKSDYELLMRKDEVWMGDCRVQNSRQSEKRIAFYPQPSCQSGAVIITLESNFRVKEIL